PQPSGAGDRARSGALLLRRPPEGIRGAMRRRGFLLGGTLLLAGCNILPKVQEPTTLYTLTPKTTYPPGLPTVNWQLVVELPTAATAPASPSATTPSPSSTTPRPPGPTMRRG